MINKCKNSIMPIICITICILFCIYPLSNIHEFLFGHDSIFHLSRIFFIENAIKNLKFPTYLSCFETIVYADQILYPSLFLNIPAFINIFIKDVYTSANIFRIIIIISSFLISFISAKIMLKDTFLATLFSILINLNFYFLFNIFDRDALGETLALIFIPLLISGLYSIYIDKNKFYYIYTIALTCILQSHILTFYYVLVFIIIFNIIFIRVTLNKDILLNVIKANVVFLLLNIWFIVPFLDYYFDKLIFFTQNNNHSIVYISTFKNLFGAFENVPFYNTANHYGIEHIFIYFFNICLLVGLQKFKEYLQYNKGEYYFAIISFIIYNFYFFLTFQNPILDILLNIDFVKNIYLKQQFSIRIVGRSIVFLVISFVFSIKIMLSVIGEKYKFYIQMIILFLICLIGIICNYKYIVDKKNSSVVMSDFDIYNILVYPDYKIIDSSTSKNEYINTTMQPDETFSELNISNKNIKVSNYNRNYLDIDFDYEIYDFNEIETYLVDLPFINYKYFCVNDDLNNNLATYYGNKDNNIRIKIDNSKGSLSIRFEPPLSWKLAKFLSIFIIVVLCRKAILLSIFKIISFVKKIFNMRKKKV